MCESGRPEASLYGIRIQEGRYSDAYLQRADVQRGYTVVIWRGRHVNEPTELDDAEAAGYWAEVLAVARASNPAAAPGRSCMRRRPTWPPWTGVERDPTTARIAALLHPQAEIINERLQSAALPAHSMDAVIGNVPFGESAVYDPTAPKAVTKNLHNYCIWRSLRTLRPGGVAVLNHLPLHTMDSRGRAARLAMADEADLVGATRLPGEALSPGGTEVVTDILVLRRRENEDTYDNAVDCLPEGPARSQQGFHVNRAARVLVVLLSSSICTWPAMPLQRSTGPRRGVMERGPA